MSSEVCCDRTTFNRDFNIRKCLIIWRTKICRGRFKISFWLPIFWRILMMWATVNKSWENRALICSSTCLTSVWYAWGSLVTSSWPSARQLRMRAHATAPSVCTALSTSTASCKSRTNQSRSVASADPLSRLLSHKILWPLTKIKQITWAKIQDSPT